MLSAKTRKQLNDISNSLNHLKNLVGIRLREISKGISITFKKAAKSMTSSRAGWMPVDPYVLYIQALMYERDQMNSKRTKNDERRL